MNQDKKIEYVNNILLNKNAQYKGPSSLFKCRKFDEYTFDMLENDYAYLCPAEKLDDETECLTTLDIEDLYNQEKDNLTVACIFKIMEFVRPYTSEDNFEKTKEIICKIIKNNGSVPADSFRNFQSIIEDLAPGVDMSPLVNYLNSIPAKLGNPESSEKIINVIHDARNARQIMNICSLCEEPNNNDVWERYGGNGSGYCIEYDMTNFDPANMVYPVLYSDERDTNIVLSIIASFIGQTIIGISGGQLKPDVSQFLRLFITKNKKWECQKEWRIISDKTDRIGSPKINRIIVGKMAAPSDRLKMAEFCKKRNIPLEYQD